MKFLTFLLLFPAMSAYAYNAVERFKIIDDKLDIEKILNPIGRRFVFGADVTINSELPSLVEDVSNVSKAPESERLSAAQKVFDKYDKTEQTVKANVVLGFPFLNFKNGDLKVSTNIRSYADLGANIGIRNEYLDLQSVYDLFGIDLPADLKAFIANEPAGNDIIADCIASGTLSDSTKEFCELLPTGKFKMPNLAVKVPNIALYTKFDLKIGFFNDYQYSENYFGFFNLYTMNRTDIYQRLTQEMIASGSDIDFPKEKNSESTLNTDFKIGYKQEGYKIAASVEELYLLTMSKRDVNSKESAYGYKPVFRIHGNKDLRFDSFVADIFAGVHKRSGYALGDGVYIGSRAGFMAFEDKLALQLKGILDKEYLTLAPHLKFWILQMEYALRLPIKSEVDGTKISALQSIYLKFLF